MRNPGSMPGVFYFSVEAWRCGRREGRDGRCPKTWRWRRREARRRHEVPTAGWEHDLDGIEVHVRRLVEKERHQFREGDQASDKDQLQHQPRDGAHIDVRRLHLIAWHDATKIEQRE